MGRLALLIIWLASVVSASAIGYAWISQHPAPKFGRVDVAGLYEEQKRVLAGRLKPGMSEEEQKAILQMAADYGKRVDEALGVLAEECGCAVLNSAAIVRLPEGNKVGMRDLTGRLRELLGQR